MFGTVDVALVCLDICGVWCWGVDLDLFCNSVVCFFLIFVFFCFVAASWRICVAWFVIVVVTYDCLWCKLLFVIDCLE